MVVKSIDIAYNFTWIIPTLRKPTTMWKLASTITFAISGLFTKTIICGFNKPVLHNLDRILNAIENRPKHVPLITVANHHSCFDDPGIWGTLPFRLVTNVSAMRFSLAAHNVCFTGPLNSCYFALVRGIPVVRGHGIYQESMNFCIELLRKGQWIHIFPEGKVNVTKEDLRLKWGIGRLIYESPVPPIVIPIWHLGMDNLLPNTRPYVFRIHQKITINFGKPIDLTDVLKLKEKGVSSVHTRKKITDKIQQEFYKLKRETKDLHAFRS